MDVSKVEQEISTKEARNDQAKVLLDVQKWNHYLIVFFVGYFRDIS